MWILCFLYIGENPRLKLHSLGVMFSSPCLGLNCWLYIRLCQLFECGVEFVECDDSFFFQLSKYRDDWGS